MVTKRSEILKDKGTTGQTWGCHVWWLALLNLARHSSPIKMVSLTCVRAYNSRAFRETRVCIYSGKTDFKAHSKRSHNRLIPHPRQKPQCYAVVWWSLWSPHQMAALEACQEHPENNQQPSIRSRTGPSCSKVESALHRIDAVPWISTGV